MKFVFIGENYFHRIRLIGLPGECFHFSGIQVVSMKTLT